MKSNPTYFSFVSGGKRLNGFASEAIIVKDVGLFPVNWERLDSYHFLFYQLFCARMRTSPWEIKRYCTRRQLAIRLYKVILHRFLEKGSKYVTVCTLCMKLLSRSPNSTFSSTELKPCLSVGLGTFSITSDPIYGSINFG